MPREVCKKETHVPTASGLLEGCFRRKRGETEHSRKKALIECRCATMYVSLLALAHCSLRSNSSAHSLGAFPRILLTMPYLFYFFLSFQVMEFQKHAFHPHFNLLLLQLMFPFLPFNGCLCLSLLLISCKTEIVSKYKYVYICIYTCIHTHTQVLLLNTQSYTELLNIHKQIISRQTKLCIPPPEHSQQTTSYTDFMLIFWNFLKTFI